MPTAILASFVPALLALGTWLQPFLRRNGPKTGAREGDHERRRGVVEWSRSEPLQRTPLDTATGEGLPGLSTGAGCSSSVGRALPEVPPEGAERGAGNERVGLWTHCSRGMCACGAACALQLGMPAAGAPGDSSSRAAGAVGHVDWGCGSTECRVHSAHHPSAAGHTPAANKFAATSSPRSLKLL